MNKYCPKCKTTKSLDEFNTDKTRKNGKCIYCRSCASISNRKSYSRRRIEVALRNKENRVGLSRYKNNYYHSNPLYKIACNIRTTLRQRIKGKNNSTKALDLLGCSVEDFKTWIESQFEPGMTWGTGTCMAGI